MRLQWHFAKKNNLDVINLLIKHGANAFPQALISACLFDIIEYIDLLIEKGAGNLKFPLAIACMNGTDRIVDYLIKKGATECVCGRSAEEHCTTQN